METEIVTWLCVRRTSTEAVLGWKQATRVSEKGEVNAHSFVNFMKLSF